MSVFEWIKLCGGIGAVIGLITLGAFVKGKIDDAARIPALEHTIKDKDAFITSNDKHLGDLAAKLVQINSDRDAMLAEIDSLHKKLDQSFGILEAQGAKTNAAVNPVCMPTDADRSLRNQAIAQYTGTRPN